MHFVPQIEQKQNKLLSPSHPHQCRMDLNLEEKRRFRGCAVKSHGLYGVMTKIYTVQFLNFKSPYLAICLIIVSKDLNWNGNADGAVFAVHNSLFYFIGLSNILLSTHQFAQKSR